MISSIQKGHQMSGPTGSVCMFMCVCVCMCGCVGGVCVSVCV